MPANLVGTSASSVVGTTLRFNNEYSSNYSSSITTTSYIYRIEPGINEDMYCVLYDVQKSGDIFTPRWSYFRMDTQSGGISWQKYFTTPSNGGIFIKYAYGTLTGGASWDRLFVSKALTGILSAVDPATGDPIHSITITTPTGGTPSIGSIEYRSNSTTGADIYIGGNYLNSSNGQEGFISKLTYNTSTGFTLSWTVAISGPPTAANELCTVESICAPYDATTSNVYCGGYVSTATNVYRPFLLALNPSTGAMVWERVFSTYDNSTPLAITSIVVDTSPATPKLVCGGTFYSYDANLATPTIIAANISTGASLVTKTIVPATSMSGYSGETKIYKLLGAVGTPVANTSFYTVGNAAFGTSSSNFSPGFFSLTSSFDGFSTHSLNASNYKNLTNSEYSLPGPYGISIYSMADYNNEIFVGGEVYKKLSAPINGVSSNQIGFLIKNNGSINGSPFTFRESGAQISYASGSPTFSAPGASFTNSSASTNLNQATVTFSIATTTPSIATYTIPKTSSVKTEYYASIIGPV